MPICKNVQNIELFAIKHLQVVKLKQQQKQQIYQNIEHSNRIENKYPSYPFIAFVLWHNETIKIQQFVILSIASLLLICESTSSSSSSSSTHCRRYYHREAKNYINILLQTFRDINKQYALEETIFVHTNILQKLTS